MYKLSCCILLSLLLSNMQAVALPKKMCVLERDSTGSSEKITDARCRSAQDNFSVGLNFLDAKVLDSAEIYFNRSIAELEKSNQVVPESYLLVYKGLANVYQLNAELKKSLAVNLKILDIHKEKGDKIGTAGTSYIIAVIFLRLKQTGNSQRYYHNLINITEELPPSSEKAHLYTKIANCYHFIYSENHAQAYLDSIEYYARKAFQLTRTTQVDRKVKFVINTRLSSVAIEKEDYEKALLLLNNNLNLCDRKTDIAELGINFSDKSYIYLTLGNYKEARKWADSSLVYTKMINSPPQVANLYQLISEIEQKSGNYKEALIALQAERSITDSLRDTENVRIVAELEKKYVQEKNISMIQRLKQEKTSYLLLSVTGLLSIIVIIFWFRHVSLQQKNKVILAEQNLNLARMNPHFFFNALASLQGLTEEENHFNKINQYLSKFSGIMRKTLESTYYEYITLEEEIEFLRQYMELQQLRFPGKFTYEITTTENLDASEIKIPTMVIQAFVENSIEHGFSKISRIGHILISFILNANELIIYIEDNGRGLQAMATSKNVYISRAIQIVRDRIYLLQAKLKTRASFSIDQHPEQEGVKVTIHLPVITGI